MANKKFKPDPSYGVVKQRFATSIFCEDIRQEASGQLNFIGVYPEGTLVLPRPEDGKGITLLKLTIFTTIGFLRDDYFENITIAVRLPNGELKEADSGSTADLASRKGIARYETSHLIVLQMIPIKEPGIISVTVIADDTPIYAGTMKVLFGDP